MVVPTVFFKILGLFVTNAPQSLTSPLVESLKHKTVKTGLSNYKNERKYKGHEQKVVEIIKKAISDYNDLKEKLLRICFKEKY